MSERVNVTIPLRQRKAVKVSDFNVKISGDNNVCYISDILIVKGTKLIVVDRSNNKLKLFGQDHKYQDSITFDDFPWCACCLSDSDVAVTIPREKTIQIVDIKDQMRKVRAIETEFQCWGIAVMNDQILITTCGDGHNIIILDRDGNKIRNFQPDSYESNNLLFPWYIKVDMASSSIYISYDTKDRFAAFSTDWNMRYIYTNQNLKTASGIDTDREGNIYQCGYRSRCLQQISKEGKFIKTLIPMTEFNTYPIVIRLYRDTDSFFVTYRYSDVVEVYNLRV